MRPIVLTACVLILAACSPQAPDGAVAPPPADAPATPPAAAPPAAAPIPEEFSGDLDARGTEPFWALQIRATQITLQRPDHPNLVAANPGLTMQGPRAVWTTTAGAVPLTVTLTVQACSDGMSDLKYSYAAQVKLGGETLKGCAGKTGAMPREG